MTEQWRSPKEAEKRAWKGDWEESAKRGIRKFLKKQRKSGQHSASEAKGKIMKLREDNVKYCKASSKIKTERCSLDLII